jgi:LPS sulfotransferase NodH
MQEIDESKRSVPEDRWIEIKYEELCSDPRSHLEDIYSRIGLPVDEKTLGRINAMARSQNFKWLEKYSVEEIELMNRNMEKPLKHYGYI